MRDDDSASAIPEYFLGRRLTATQNKMIDYTTNVSTCSCKLEFSNNSQIQIEKFTYWYQHNLYNKN
jgi:hypothetical protein